jgi:hypothetical protein
LTWNWLPIVRELRASLAESSVQSLRLQDKCDLLEREREGLYRRIDEALTNERAARDLATNIYYRTQMNWSPIPGAPAPPPAAEPVARTGKTGHYSEARMDGLRQSANAIDEWRNKLIARAEAEKLHAEKLSAKMSGKQAAADFGKNFVSKDGDKLAQKEDMVISE